MWPDASAEGRRQVRAAVVVSRPRPTSFDHPVGANEQRFCNEGNAHVGIGEEVYDLGADGLLVPVKRGQPPPDLRFFKPSGH